MYNCWNCLWQTWWWIRRWNWKLNAELSQDIFTRSSKLHWFTGQQMRALALDLPIHPHAYCTVKVTQQACLNSLHHKKQFGFSANTIGWLQLLNNYKLTKEITRRHILMLPLTRNIFRQTATSFNNTTKRWKQESYYTQIEWWSSLNYCQNLHQWQKVKNDCCGEWHCWEGMKTTNLDEKKVHLIIFFLEKVMSLLNVLKASQKKSKTLVVIEFAKMWTSVLRERCVRQWAAGSSFGFRGVVYVCLEMDNGGCVMKTIGTHFFPHPSRLALQFGKSCLICPKQSQGGNNRFFFFLNAPQKWRYWYLGISAG